MSSFFSLFSFFATGYGVLLTLLLPLLLLAIWDWRLTLAVIVIVQLAVGTLMITFQAVAPEWMGVQLLVMILCCAILAISVIQMPTTSLLRRRGNFVMHFLLAPLLIAAWWLLQIDLPLTSLNSAVRQLFLWLMTVALVQMSIGNDPMSVGASLLIWCIPLHALAVYFTPIPALLAMIGLMELLIAFACAYLIITDRNPALTPPKQAIMLMRDRNRSNNLSEPAPIPVTRNRAGSEKVTG